MATISRTRSASETQEWPLSAYVKSLDAVRVTIHKETPVSGGSGRLPDPYLYCLQWEDNPVLWPDVTFGDIYAYLIDTPGRFIAPTIIMTGLKLP